MLEEALNQAMSELDSTVSIVANRVEGVSLEIETLARARAVQIVEELVATIKMYGAETQPGGAEKEQYE